GRAGRTFGRAPGTSTALRLPLGDHGLQGRKAGPSTAHRGHPPRLLRRRGVGEVREGPHTPADRPTRCQRRTFVPTRDHRTRGPLRTTCSPAYENPPRHAKP